MEPRDEESFVFWSPGLAVPLSLGREVRRTAHTAAYLRRQSTIVCSLAVTTPARESFDSAQPLLLDIPRQPTSAAAAFVQEFRLGWADCERSGVHRIAAPLPRSPRACATQSFRSKP